MKLLHIADPNNAIFRIHSIEMFNFRNIEHSKIVFPNSETTDLQKVAPSVLGIYGENGSGKTSVVLALSLLKQLVSGSSVTDRYTRYIRSGCERATVVYEFTYNKGSFIKNANLSNFERDAISNISKLLNYEISYSVDIVSYELSEKQNNNHGKAIQIENERLTIKVGQGNTIIIPKQVFIDTTESICSGKNQAFGSRSKYKLFTQGDSELQSELCKNKVELKRQSKSFIFSSELFLLLAGKYSSSKAHKLIHAFSHLSLTVDEICSLEDHRNEQIILSFRDLLSENCELNGFDFDVDYINSADEDRLFELAEKFILLLLSEIKNEFNTSTDIDKTTDIELMLDEVLSLREEIETNELYKEQLQFNHLMEILYIVSTAVVDKLHVIGTNRNLPIVLRYSKYNKLTNSYESTYRVMPLKLNEATRINSNIYSEIVDSIDGLSQVLSILVPNLSLTIKDFGIIKEDNKDFREIEVLAIRNGITIPLKNESDGIRRLVSIISPLIGVYNDPSIMLVVDEIDSGLYEFLLGDLLQAMVSSNQKQKTGKGQLIFTAHNLRPLEVLPYKCIAFTTRDPKDRFTSIALRGNSNLRDTYENYYKKKVLGLKNKKDIRTDIAEALLKARE